MPNAAAGIQGSGRIAQKKGERGRQTGGGIINSIFYSILAFPAMMDGQNTMMLRKDTKHS
jgi:hypothetical protein